MNTILSEIYNVITNNNIISTIISNLLSGLLYIWNYKIYATSENESIMIGSIITAFLMFLIGLKIARHITTKLKNKFSSKLEKNAASILESITYYFLLSVAIIIALDIAHVPLTFFTVIGSTIALGIGLGSQHMVNNFISGLFILMEQPIKVGDIIEVKNIIGEVINIGSRCVKIKTQENIIMLIPNSQIIQGMILNWTHNDNNLKYSLIVEVENSCSIKTFDAIIANILSSHEKSSKLRDGKSSLVGIGENSYIMEISICVKVASDSEIKHIVDSINRALIEKAKKAKIKIIRTSLLEHIRSKQQ